MTAAMAHEPEGRHQSKVAAASGWIGSALEYYDFFIYATAASLVFPQIFFPSTNPTVAIVASLATYGVGYVARPDRRVRARPPGRHLRPQERAFDLPRPDGSLNHRGRTASDLSAGWSLGARPAGGPATHPGLRGRGRDIRRELDDPRTRSFRTARLFRELYPARRAGGTNSRRRGLSALELRAAKRGLRDMGVARAVPAQRSRPGRRLHYSARGRGDARLHRGASASRDSEGADHRRFDQPLAGHAAGRLHGADERHSGGGDHLRRRLRRAAGIRRRNGQNHLLVDSRHRQHRGRRRDSVRRQPFGQDRPPAADHHRLARGGPADLRLSLRASASRTCRSRS